MCHFVFFFFLQFWRLYYSYCLLKSNDDWSVSREKEIRLPFISSAFAPIGPKKPKDNA